MQFHANAKLGLSGRFALVRAIEQGMSLKAAAAAFNVSPATAHRWWHRWLAAEARRPSVLVDRSSRPRRSPRQLAASEEERIVRARLETGYGPNRLAGIVDRAASSVWKVLRRRQLSPRPRAPRPRYRRYEWSRPGALLHMDVKKLPRFDRPGHQATGDRSQRSRSVGYDYLHCVLDDHSRFVHVEQHPREDADTNLRTLQRALDKLAELGLDPPEAVMTDNAFVYTKSARFQALLTTIGARHILIPAYTPRWNGKVERFIGTLLNEWAYSHRWSSAHERARALPSFIRYYNRRRPHGSLEGQAPISRVHNVCGEDS